MSQGSLKNFSFIAFSRLISSSLQGVFYLVIATLLDPVIYGEMSYFIALAGTFSILSRFGLPISIVVYQAKKDFQTVDQINSFAVISTTIAALILIPLNIFAAILCLGISFFIMNQQNLLGLKNYKKFFLIFTLRSVLVLAIPIILYFPFEIPGILIGMAIGNFVAGIGFLKFVRIKINSFKTIRRNFKVLLHNYGVELSSSLVRTVDKLVIVPFFGFLSTGIYQFNLQILFFLALLPNSLYFFLLTEQSSGRRHRKITFITIVSSVILVVLTTILAPFLIPQFFPKYSEGIFGLQILTISLLPLTLTAILNAKLQAEESTKVGIPAAIRISSLVILIVILGSVMGLEGLFFAVLFSSILETITLTIIYKKSSHHYPE